MFTFKQLLEILDLEQLDTNLFRGDTLPSNLTHLYGGQVFAQSLSAAIRTVEEDRLCHSVHSYFLRPGDKQSPIIFYVEPTRDGGTFTTRRVVAEQKGKAIFHCEASFQLEEEGLTHQIDLNQDIPAPLPGETSSQWDERIEQPDSNFQNLKLIPEDVIQVRSISASVAKDSITTAGLPDPVRGFWFKYEGFKSDNPVEHQLLLSYISDLAFLGTALNPHRAGLDLKKMQIASLDHSLWLHTRFDVSEWIYFHMDSPRSAHARGFSRGSFYSEGGALVASAAQEGLIRQRG